MSAELVRKSDGVPQRNVTSYPFVNFSDPDCRTVVLPPDTINVQLSGATKPELVSSVTLELPTKKQLDTAQFNDAVAAWDSQDPRGLQSRAERFRKISEIGEEKLWGTLTKALIGERPSRQPLTSEQYTGTLPFGSVMTLATVQQNGEILPEADIQAPADAMGFVDDAHDILQICLGKAPLPPEMAQAVDYTFSVVAAAIASRRLRAVCDPRRPDEKRVVTCSVQKDPESGDRVVGISAYIDPSEYTRRGDKDHARHSPGKNRSAQCAVDIAQMLSSVLDTVSVVERPETTRHIKFDDEGNSCFTAHTPPILEASMSLGSADAGSSSSDTLPAVVEATPINDEPGPTRLTFRLFDSNALRLPEEVNRVTTPNDPWDIHGRPRTTVTVYRPVV